MNGQQLRTFHVGRGHRAGDGQDEVRGWVRELSTFTDGQRILGVTDGYEFMSAADQHGWRTISSWANEGYDLGEWPYVVFSVKGPKVGMVGDVVGDSAGEILLCTHVEGDLDFWRFPDNPTRRAAISYLFVWYAVHAGKSWAKNLAGEPWDPEDERTWPANVHGPYRFLEPAEATA